MPTYMYQIIRKDGSEGEILEFTHRMSDPTLREHPDTGEKMVRVFQVPNVADSSSSHERIQKERTSDANCERMGFTKYVRNGKGNYERRAGSFGPDRLGGE